MPLASAGVWFSSDTGDLRISTRRRPRPEGGFASPVGAIVSEAMEMAACHGGDNAIRRRRQRFQADDNSDRSWLLPVVWIPSLTVPADSSQPWQRRPRPIAPSEGLVPIWTWGTGQPVPPLGWGQDDGSLHRPRVPFRTPQEILVPCVIGLADISYELIGWRVDPSPMRWRRPVFRADEITGLPPQAVFVEEIRYYAALIAPQPDLVRARKWKATAHDADASAIYKAVSVTTDHLGWVDWDVPQPRVVYRQQRAWSDPGAWPVLDATIQPVPMVFSDSGDRQVARQPWRGNVTEHTEPMWQGAGLISIPGFYVLVAAQLWQPGLVEGQIQSTN